MVDDINKIEFAIVRNGSQTLGNCYYQYDFLVYVGGVNPDDTQYDNVCTSTSAQKRDRIANMLPSSNAGCFLGKFDQVGSSNVWVASAYIRIDSGD